MLVVLAALSIVASEPFPPMSMAWPASQLACAEVAVTVAVNTHQPADGDLLDYQITAGHNHGPPTAIDDPRSTLHTYYVLAGNTPVLVHNTQGCGPRFMVDSNGVATELVPPGAANLRDGAHMTTNNALDTAVEFLGPGYRDMGGGRFLSQDGLRQVRMTDADLVHPRQSPHINFETYSQPIGPGIRGGQPVSNIHIRLPEEPGWHLP